MTQDCDAAYEEQYGHHETPSGFAGRYGQKKLTEEEAAACEGATTPEEAFRMVYPEWVGRHEFREAWFATPEPSEPAPTRKKKTTPEA